MNVSFEPGEVGYHEARELKAMARYVLDHTVAGSHDQQFLERVENIAIEHLDRPEFAALREHEAPAREDRPPLARLCAALRDLVGPSRREMTLAQQRGEALERAQRAEQSAFEAIAETAKVGRERDQALSRLAALEAQAAALARALEEQQQGRT